MRELGEASVEEHKNIVRKLVAADIPAWLVGEEFGKALLELGITPGSDPLIKGNFLTSENLASYIASNPAAFSGQTILVKGSRGIQMEKTIPEL